MRTERTPAGRSINAVRARRVLGLGLCLTLLLGEGWASAQTPPDDSTPPTSVAEEPTPSTEAPPSTDLPPPPPGTSPDVPAPVDPPDGDGLSTQEAPQAEPPVAVKGPTMELAEPVTAELTADQAVAIDELGLRLSVGDGSLLRDSETLPAEATAVDTAAVLISPTTPEQRAKAGLEAGAFRLELLAGADGQPLETPVVVRAEVDYSALLVGQSSDFRHRLRFVRAIPCADEEATLPGGAGPCRDPEVLTVDNDEDADSIVAEFVLEPSDEPSVPTTVSSDSTTTTVPATSTPTTTVVPLVDDLEPSATTPVTTGTDETTVESTTPSGPAGFGRRASGDVVGRYASVRRQSGGGGSTYGLSAGFSSNFGSYQATPLASSSSWEVGLQAGSFEWSYPVPVPPAGWGTAPELSFNYSSSAVDGVVSDENTQAGPLGYGWNVSSGGYIERSYRICAQDAGGWIINDFCW